MVAPFLHAVGSERICRDSFQEGQSEIEQFAGAQYVAHRISNSPTLVPRLSEQTVHAGGTVGARKFRQNRCGQRDVRLACARTASRRAGSAGMPCHSLRAINRQSSQSSPSKRLPRSGGTAPHTRQVHPSDLHKFAHASSFLRSASSLLMAPKMAGDCHIVSRDRVL